NGPRDDFLAGAALARDQHLGVGARDALDFVRQRGNVGAPADKVYRPVRDDGHDVEGLEAGFPPLWPDEKMSACPGHYVGATEGHVYRECTDRRQICPVGFDSRREESVFWDFRNKRLVDPPPG